MRAFVFPGQGAQAVGMGRELAQSESIAKNTYEEADDALGFSLSRICFEGPDADLALTAHAQPAILTTSIALLRVLQHRCGVTPDWVAGHSLGEYTALVCAEALPFAEAVRTVHRRGLYMQEAVPAGQGAMAALMGLDNERVGQICAEAAQGEVVSPANFNGGNQVVIAGDNAAVARAVAAAKSAGARAVPLKVSAPFHCALMAPAADRLASDLRQLTIAPLKIPVITNVEAKANTDAARVTDLLVRQVTASVLWEASVMHAIDQGVRQFVEIGPGKVLTGLIKRIQRKLGVELDLVNVGQPDQLNAAASALG